jgi:N-acetyl-anhydromuramyl-L-alanine amidase AmpD
MSILEKITMSPLLAGQYFDEVTTKNQIYVHHTAGNPDPFGVVSWWASTPDRVATAFIIGGRAKSNTSKWKDGQIVQCFNSNRWAYHLGLTAANIKAGNPGAKDNVTLNKNSIGIEICDWGCLTLGPKGYTTYVNTTVPEAEVQEYTDPFRGYKYYHKYSQAQMDTIHELVSYLCTKWSITKEYKGDQIFNICIGSS